MNKHLLILALILCFFALPQTTQAQSKAELKEQVVKAQQAEKLAVIQAREALEAKKIAEVEKEKALLSEEQAKIAHKEALLSKMQAEKTLEQALKALEVANAEKAILEKKVAELTKNQKKK